MKKGTKLYSILKLKCPRCQIGNLFANPGVFVFSKVLEMPDRCPNCQQDFKLEPGFYTAALWISYPLVLVVFIPLIIYGLSLKSLSTLFRIGFPLIVVLALILQIPIMRLSRAILLNITVDYKN